MKLTALELFNLPDIIIFIAGDSYNTENVEPHDFNCYKQPVIEFWQKEGNGRVYLNHDTEIELFNGAANVTFGIPMETGSQDTEISLVLQVFALVPLSKYLLSQKAIGAL